MRYTRAIAVVGLCCVLCITELLGGCAARPPYRRETYVVRPQDTLYSIAWRHDVDFRDLARWNNIGPDYRLSVGQVLLLQPEGGPAEQRARTVAGPASGAVPSALAQPPTSARAQGGARVGSPKALPDVPGGAAGASARAAPNAGSPGSGAGSPGGGADESGGVGPGRGVDAGGGAGQAAGAGPGSGVSRPGIARAGAAAGGGGGHWLWPTEHSAPPRPVPGGGILLFGRLGQDVRAAGAGRVVYTGSGIRGYGNLIIVKHGDNLLSSYAHNSELLVREGQDVFMGQIIAHMGTAAHQTSALYFEIRLNGKPVDPLRYLPAAK